MMDDFERDLALATEAVDALASGTIPDAMRDEAFATIKATLTVAFALTDGAPEPQRGQAFARMVALVTRLEGIMGALWCTEGSQIFRRAALRAFVAGAKSREVSA